MFAFLKMFGPVQEIITDKFRPTVGPLLPTTKVFLIGIRRSGGTSAVKTQEFRHQKVIVNR